VIRERCPCGWPKPLIAVANGDGSLPAGAMLVRVLCPQCETPYNASERPRSDVAEGAAKVEAAAPAAIPLRYLLDFDEDDDDTSDPNFDSEPDDGGD
jgi:hypothetical protein